MDTVKFQRIEWGLGILVVAASVLAWYQGRNVAAGGGLSVYDLFPLFGLLAFGLMWTHYVNGALRRYWKLEKSKNDLYWTVSVGLVLVLIIGHPLLLNYGLLRDGLGLPPGSYSSAYPGKEQFLMLGTFALLLFLAFELRRWFSDKSWWKYVEYAQLVAMTAIFVHAVALGREVASGWFMALWWIYGITLATAVLYSRMIDMKQKEGR